VGGGGWEKTGRKIKNKKKNHIENMITFNKILIFLKNIYNSSLSFLYLREGVHGYFYLSKYLITKSYRQ